MKRTLKPGAMLYPLPAVLVTGGTMEKPTVMTAAWTGIVCSDPPMTYVSIRPERYSHDVIRDADSIFNFVITDVYTNDTEPGIIISQKPDPGRSMSIENDGVTVEISVSRSMTSIEVPEVAGMEYRDAADKLQKMGFAVEIESATSDTVAHNYVISSSPAAHEMVISGSLIYLSVSSGPQVIYVEMPNLIGLSEEAAIRKLESNNLSYSGSDWVDSPLDRGTVVGQNIQIGERIEEHSKVTLQVSQGEN